jgi:hypothetical protein
MPQTPQTTLFCSAEPICEAKQCRHHKDLPWHSGAAVLQQRGVSFSMRDRMI